MEQDKEFAVMMVPQLVTERLILNEITEEDTSLIVKWRSNPDVYQFFLSPHPLTEEEHRDWYENQYLYDDHRFDWVAIEKNSGVPAGIFGIKRKDGKTGEVSYLVAPEFQKKGYAREAVERILEFALEEWTCNLMMAEIHVDNQESANFIKNLGFVFSGTKGNFSRYERIL